MLRSAAGPAYNRDRWTSNTSRMLAGSRTLRGNLNLSPFHLPCATVVLPSLDIVLYIQSFRQTQAYPYSAPHISSYWRRDRKCWSFRKRAVRLRKQPLMAKGSLNSAVTLAKVSVLLLCLFHLAFTWYISNRIVHTDTYGHHAFPHESPQLVDRVRDTLQRQRASAVFQIDQQEKYENEELPFYSE